MHIFKITHIKMHIYQIEQTAAAGQIYIYFLILKSASLKWARKIREAITIDINYAKQHTITNFFFTGVSGNETMGLG